MTATRDDGDPRGTIRVTGAAARSARAVAWPWPIFYRNAR